MRCIPLIIVAALLAAGHVRGQSPETSVGPNHRAQLPAEVLPPADAKGDSNESDSPTKEKEPPLPLAPQSDSAKSEPTTGTSPTGAMTTVFGSLAVVVGLFFLVVWLTRRALPRVATSLPKDVVEVLGKAPLAGRGQVTLIRFGKKIVLVGMTQNGVQTLSEVTDPDEADRLAGLCNSGKKGSVTQSFRQVLSQMSREPTSRSRAAAMVLAALLIGGLASAASAQAPSFDSRGPQPVEHFPRYADAGTSRGRPIHDPAVRPAASAPADYTSGDAPTGEAGDAATEAEPAAPNGDVTRDFLTNPEEWTSPKGLNSALKIMLVLTVLSLAPAVLLMTTSFVRIVVVLGLLRQAIGAQSLPPSQVITALAIFLTVLIMTPVWTDVYNDAILPYSNGEIESGEIALERGIRPVRRFMARQIDVAANTDDVWLFYQYLPEDQREVEPETYDDVPIQVLLPAFMLSELKTAFLIGFQIYLPFLILDIVISSVTISMGMMMLPPAMISLPFKIMLFVLVNGWNLVVGMLLASFAPYT